MIFLLTRVIPIPGNQDHLYLTAEQIAILERLMPKTRMAKAYGVSDVALRKTFRKHVELNGRRGSWRQIETGHAVGLAPPKTRIESTGKCRESTRIQAVLVQIGQVLGFSAYIPPGDRKAVSRELGVTKSQLSPQLPVSRHSPRFNGISFIDVLWLQRGAIVAAFEVEHTTDVRVGIARLESLLREMTGRRIALHIICPKERRPKVRREIGNSGLPAEGSWDFTYDEVQMFMKWALWIMRSESAI